MRSIDDLVAMRREYIYSEKQKQYKDLIHRIENKLVMHGECTILLSEYEIVRNNLTVSLLSCKETELVFGQRGVILTLPGEE